MIRKTEIYAWNEGGEYKAYASNDSEKTLTQLVCNSASYLLENANGQCEIVIHINPSNYDLVNHVHQTTDRRAYKL